MTSKIEKAVSHRIGIVHLRELVARVNEKTNRSWAVTRFSSGYAIRQNGEAGYVFRDMEAKEAEALLDGVLLGVGLGGR